jgi:hypothetical protein
MGIKWHDGINGKPSNHLCDSMVCGVNFLFPFYDQPEALAELFRPIYPNIKEMLAIEADQFVAFEWIGEENYLRERISKGGKRARGANFTSADAAVMFKMMDGSTHFLLIEWKYTESYGSTPLRFSKSGTDRLAIYRHLLDAPDCPIDLSQLPNLDALFYEPFYQFMRQQLLANEMEKAHELGADIASLLHIAPGNNDDFKKITSPDLRPLGNKATAVWSTLLHDPGKFTSVQTEKMFGHFSIEELPELIPWKTYIDSRYGWIAKRLNQTT